MTPPLTVLIDARNVLRSKWPNIPEAELVELARRWAVERGYQPVIVFDGRGPQGTACGAAKRPCGLARVAVQAQTSSARAARAQTTG